MNPRSEVHRTGSKNRTASSRKGKPMPKKPTIIEKGSARSRGESNGIAQNLSVEEMRETDRPESPTEVVNQDSASQTTPDEAEERPSDPIGGDDPSAPSWPPMPGFELEGANRNQQYAVRSMVILCDCCVQNSPDGVFDVLARNFDTVTALMWWLRKIGKGHLVRRVKGKDVVDAVRNAAHDLNRELKVEIGLPVARL